MAFASSMIWLLQEEPKNTQEIKWSGQDTVWFSSNQFFVLLNLGSCLRE